MKDRLYNKFKDFDREFCQKYIKTYQSNAYQEIKASVNLMMRNTFVFNDNWDMEPCSKAYCLDPLEWDKPVTDDPEWLYMLNRQTYLFKFLVVYIVEGDKSYLRQMKYFMYHWIDCQFTLKPEGAVSRTIDTGIRCMSWLKVLIFLDYFGLITETKKIKLLTSLREQITYMRDYYREKDSLSNWGILQTTAILACLYYYEDELNLPEIQSFAEEELLLQIKLQILDDGSQYEQSIMYHVEVLKSLMELVILAPKYYLPLEETIEKMVTYLIAMTGPDYCQLAIGDSDVTDTRDILTLATLVLKSSKTKSFSFDNVNLETLLLFGKPSIYLFEEIPRATIGESAYLFPDSGHVCLRDDRRYIFFKNGPFGSAHTHSDNNSVCLYDKKKPIFIDAGRYTYKEEQLRYDFKRSTSHSTCTLDGQPLEMIKDSWTYNSYPKCDYCQLTSKDRYHLVEGQLHVQRASDIYYHKRWLLTLPQAITLVIDKVSCPGEHVLTNQYILDDQVIYENGFVNDLKLVSPTTFNLEDCLISKRYNQLTESHKLVKKIKFVDEVMDYTLIVDRNCQVKYVPLVQTNSHKELSNSIAFDIRSQDFHYLIGVLMDDIIFGDKLYLMQGIKCKGKVIVYDKNNGKMSRLKN